MITKTKKMITKTKKNNTKPKKYNTKPKKYNTKPKKNNIKPKKNNSKNNSKRGGGKFLNTLSRKMFYNTGKTNLSYRGIGSQAFRNTKRSISSFQQGNKANPDLLTLIYNNRTPNQITINNSTLNTIYESSKLSTAPHVQVNNMNHFLLVMILPGNENRKPKLLWAKNFKNRSSSIAIINYLLPKQKKLPIGSIYKVVFKLYRYPETIKEPFKLEDSLTIKRKIAMQRLNTYLINNNMLNLIATSYIISIKKDAQKSMNSIFTL
jgi:hypothetical protein